MKTRIMTAAAESSVSGAAILAGMLKKEGPIALFKGALPRAVWTAPLGAMNFAGYELAKKALSEREAAKERERAGIDPAASAGAGPAERPRLAPAPA